MPTIIPIAKIHSAFYVRKVLNEARVSQLIKLVQGGVTLEPIEVWQNPADGFYELIAGRHRVEAYTRLEQTEVLAHLIDEPEFDKRVARAVQSNEGGALTPTDDDYASAIATMLDHGTPRKRIIEIFPLPKSYTIQMIHNVLSKRAHVAINRAVSDVTNHGLTVAQAAAKHDVDPASLKAALDPKGRRKAPVTTADFLSGAAQRFKAFSMSNTADYKKLMDAWEDGVLTTDECRAVIASLAKRYRNAVAMLEDWRARFETRVSDSELKEIEDAAKAR